MLMQLIHAARRGDWTMFEYLLERGAVLPSNIKSAADAQAVAGVVGRREDWLAVAACLAHRYHVPLTAVRTIHEFVVGFNWSVVCQAI